MARHGDVAWRGARSGMEAAAIGEATRVGSRASCWNRGTVGLSGQHPKLIWRSDPSRIGPAWLVPVLRKRLRYSGRFSVVPLLAQGELFSRSAEAAVSSHMDERASLCAPSAASLRFPGRASCHRRAVTDESLTGLLVLSGVSSRSTFTSARGACNRMSIPDQLDPVVRDPQRSSRLGAAR